MGCLLLEGGFGSHDLRTDGGDVRPLNKARENALSGPNRGPRGVEWRHENKLVHVHWGPSDVSPRARGPVRTAQLAPQATPPLPCLPWDPASYPSHTYPNPQFTQSHTGRRGNGPTKDDKQTGPAAETGHQTSTKVEDQHREGLGQGAADPTRTRARLWVRGCWRRVPGVSRADPVSVGLPRKKSHRP